MVVRCHWAAILHVARRVIPLVEVRRFCLASSHRCLRTPASDCGGFATTTIAVSCPLPLDLLRRLSVHFKVHEVVVSAGKVYIGNLLRVEALRVHLEDRVQVGVHGLGTTG